jgi:hypothetical protein
MAVRHDKYRAPSLFLPVATCRKDRKRVWPSNLAPYDQPVTVRSAMEPKEAMRVNYRCCGQLGGFSCA